jgi:hypothetical protein
VAGGEVQRQRQAASRPTNTSSTRGRVADDTPAKPLDLRSFGGSVLGLPSTGFSTRGWAVSSRHRRSYSFLSSTTKRAAPFTGVGMWSGEPSLNSTGTNLALTEPAS